MRRIAQQTCFRIASLVVILAMIHSDLAWASGGDLSIVKNEAATIRPLAVTETPAIFELEDAIQQATNPVLHNRIKTLIQQLDVDRYLTSEPRSELRTEDYRAYLRGEIKGSLGPLIMEAIRSGDVTPPPLELPMPIAMSQIPEDVTPKEKILSALQAVRTMMEETDRAVLNDFTQAIDEALESVFQKARRDRTLTAEKFNTLLRTQFQAAYRERMKQQIATHIRHASQLQEDPKEKALPVSEVVGRKYQRVPRFIKWILSENPQLENDREVQEKLSWVNQRLNQLPEVPDEVVEQAIQKADAFLQGAVHQEPVVNSTKEKKPPALAIGTQVPKTVQEPVKAEPGLLRELARVSERLEAKRKEESDLRSALAELQGAIRNEKEEIVLKALNKAKEAKASLHANTQAQIKTLEKEKADLETRLGRSELRGKASFSVREVFKSLVRFKRPQFGRGVGFAVEKLAPTFFLGWVWGGILLWYAYHTWNWDEIKLYTWTVQNETSSITVTGLLWLVEIFLTPFLHVGFVALASFPVVLIKEVIQLIGRVISFPVRLGRISSFDQTTELTDDLVKRAAKDYAKLDSNLLLRIFESWKERNASEKVKRLLSDPRFQGRHQKIKQAIEHEDLKRDLRQSFIAKGQTRVFEQLESLERRAGIQKNGSYQQFDHAVKAFLDDGGISPWVQFLMKVPERSLPVVIRDIDHVLRARSRLNGDGNFDELPDVLRAYELKRGPVSTLTESFVLGLLTPQNIPIEERIQAALRYDSGEKLRNLGLPESLTDLNEPVSLDELSRVAANDSKLKTEFGSGPIKRMIQKMGQDGLYSYYESERPPYYVEFLGDVNGMTPGFNRPEEKFRVAYDREEVKDSSLDQDTLPLASPLDQAKALIKSLRTKYPNLYENFIGPKREILKGEALDSVLDVKSMNKVITLFIHKVPGWEAVPESERAEFFLKALQMIHHAELIFGLAQEKSPRKQALEYWRRVRVTLKGQTYLSQTSKLYAVMAKIVDSKIERLTYEETAGRKGMMQFYLSGKTFVDFFRGCASFDCTARRGEEGTVGQFSQTMAVVPDPAFFLFKIIENKRWIGNIYSLVTKDKDGKTYLFIDMFSISPAHTMTEVQKKQMARRFFEAAAQWAGEIGLDGIILSSAASQRDNVGSPLKEAVMDFAKDGVQSHNLRKAGGKGYFSEFGLHEEYIQNFGGEATSGLRFIRGFLIPAKPVDRELERARIQLFKLQETVFGIQEESERLKKAKAARIKERSILDARMEQARRERKIAVEEALRTERSDVQVAVDRIGLELGELQGRIKQAEFRFENLKTQLNGHRSELRFLSEPLAIQSGVFLAGFGPLFFMAASVLGGYLIWTILKGTTPQENRHTDVYQPIIPLAQHFTKPELEALLAELDRNLSNVMNRVPRGLKERFGEVKPRWEEHGKSQVLAIRRVLEVLKNQGSVFTFLKGTDFYGQFKIQTKSLGLPESFDEPGTRVPLKGVSNGYLELSAREAEDLYRGDVSCDCTSFTQGSAFFETVPQFLFDPGFLNFKVVLNGKWMGNVYLLVAKDENDRPVVVIDAVQISPWVLKNGALKPLTKSIVRSVFEWSRAQGFRDVFLSKFISNFYRVYQILDPLFPARPVTIEKVGGFDHLKALGFWEKGAYRNQYLETFSPRWNQPLAVSHNESKASLFLRRVNRSELRTAEPPVVLTRKDGIRVTMPPKTTVETDKTNESFKALTPQATQVEGSLSDGVLKLLTKAGMLGVLNPTSLFSLAGYKFILPFAFKIVFIGEKHAEVKIGDMGIVKYDHDQKNFEITYENDVIKMTGDGEVVLPWLEEPLRIPEGSTFKVTKASIHIETPEGRVFEIKKPEEKVPEREQNAPEESGKAPVSMPLLASGLAGFGAQILDEIEKAFAKEKETKLLQKLAQSRQKADALKLRIHEEALQLLEKIKTFDLSQTPQELVDTLEALRRSFKNKFENDIAAILNELADFKKVKAFDAHNTEIESISKNTQGALTDADQALLDNFRETMRQKLEQTKSHLKEQTERLLQRAGESVESARARPLEDSPSEISNAIDALKRDLVEVMQTGFSEMEREVMGFEFPALEALHEDLTAYFKSRQETLLTALQALWTPVPEANSLDEGLVPEVPQESQEDQEAHTQLPPAEAAPESKEPIRDLTTTDQRTKRLARVSEQIKKRIAVLRNLKARERDLKASLTNLEQEVEEADRTLRMKTEEIAEEERRFREIDQMLQDRRNEVETLEQTARRLTQAAPELAALEESAGKLKEEVTHLAADKESLEGVISTLQKEAETLSIKKQDMIRAIAELQSRMTAYEERLTSQSEEEASIGRRLQNARTEEKDLSDSLERLKVERRSMAQSLGAISDEVTDLTARFSRLKADVDALEARKQALTDELGSVEEIKPKINVQRLVKRLREYLQIPSGSGREEEFRKRLITELQEIGGHEVKLKRLKKPLNLIWDIPAADDFKGVLHKIGLNAHMDRTTHNVTDVSLKDGFLYAQGRNGNAGLDDTLGVAAIMEALTTLKEKKIPHPLIRVIFTVEEERGFQGAADIVERHPEIVQDLDLLVPIDGPLLDRESQHQFRHGPPGENVLPLAVKFMNLQESGAIRDWVHRVGTAVGEAVWQAARSGIVGMGAVLVKHKPAEFTPSAGDERRFMSTGVGIAHFRVNHQDATGHVPNDSAKIEHFVLLTEWVLALSQGIRSELRMFPPPPSDDDFLYPHQPEGGVNDFSDMESVFEVTDYLREHQETDIVSYILAQMNQGKNLILWNVNGPTPWILKDLGKIIRELLERKKIAQIHLDLPKESQELVYEFLRRGKASPELIWMIESRFPPFLPQEFRRPDLYLDILRQVHEFNIDQPDQKKIKVIAYYDKVLPPIPEFGRGFPRTLPPNPFQNPLLERIVGVVSGFAEENPDKGYLIVKPIEDELPARLRQNPRVLSILHVDKHTGFGPQKPENKLAMFMSQQASDNQKSFALPILPDAPFYGEEINAVPRNLPVPKQGFNEFRNYPHLVMSTGSEDKSKDTETIEPIPDDEGVKPPLSPMPVGGRSELRQGLSQVFQEREDAITELIHIGKPAVPTLVVALDEPSTSLRLGAIQVLGNLGDTRVASHLNTLASDQELSGAVKDAIQAIAVRERKRRAHAARTESNHGIFWDQETLRFLQHTLQDSRIQIELDAESLLRKKGGRLEVTGSGFMESVRALKRLLPVELTSRLSVEIINFNEAIKTPEIERAFGLARGLKGIVSVRNAAVGTDRTNETDPAGRVRSVQIAYEKNMARWQGAIDILVKTPHEGELVDGRKLFLAALLKKQVRSRLSKTSNRQIERLLTRAGMKGMNGLFVLTPEPKAYFDAEFLMQVELANQMLAGSV